MGNKEKREQSDGKNAQFAVEFATSGYDTLWSYCVETGIPYHSLYKYIKRNRSDIVLSRATNGNSKAHLIAQRNRSKRPDADILHDLYWKQGLTMIEVGERYGVSSGSVCHWFQELGIKARDNTERVEMWMDDAHKEHFRKLANDGKIGVHKWKGEWQGNNTTWIEAALSIWLKENNIEFEREYQIEDGTHRFDFLVKNTNLLIETDGVYFHNRPIQVDRDISQEEYAKEKGYRILRFTDKEIKTTNGKCFEEIKNAL